MDYIVGDLQGCCDALERLLAEIGFSPSRDHLAVVGDLVNRGPDSLGTLKRLRGLGDAATCLLVAASLAPLAAGDPERYLALVPVLTLMTGVLCLIAGALPQLDCAQTCGLIFEHEQHPFVAPPEQRAGRSTQHVIRMPDRDVCFYAVSITECLALCYC